MKNNRVTIRDVYEQIENFREEVRDTYVSKSEFWPVKTIVYGIVGTSLLAVLGAIVAQVIKAR